MEGIKKNIFKFFEVNFLRFATSIIIPSPYVLKKTKELLPNKKVNYIEIAFDNNVSVKKTFEMTRQLLYVGTIEFRKGLHLLIDVLSQLKKDNNKFTINIVGSIVDTRYYK